MRDIWKARWILKSTTITLVLCIDLCLQKRKMMDGIELTDLQNDLRGICATGRFLIRSDVDG